jgi:plastocyanin
MDPQVWRAALTLCVGSSPHGVSPTCVGDRSRGPARRWTSLAAGLLAPLLLAAGLAGAGRPAPDTGTIQGAIEGEIRVPAAATARTAERYVSSTGETREIATIPVVVFVQGAVPSAPAARASGRPTVAQANETFRPGILVVPVGAEVAFPNEDPIFHNVFSYSRPKRFDLGRYRQGESKSVVFDRPGYIKVMCEVHKWMRAGIVVVENPYYAIVSDSGQFRIDGVPAGRYRVAVEHFDRRSQVLDVVVPAGGTARIQVSF